MAVAGRSSSTAAVHDDQRLTPLAPVRPLGERGDRDAAAASFSDCGSGGRRVVVRAHAQARVYVYAVWRVRVRVCVFLF